MNILEEEWRAIPGYEGLYDVSNLGQIRSYDRLITRRSGKQVLWKGRTLKPNAGSKGHYRVNLFREGKSEMVYVHQVVAKVFIPNPEGHPLVRHLDDVKENNHVSNLAWGTHSDNRQDALRNGVQYGVPRSDRPNCKHGHEYTEANTYWDARGNRACRTCKRNYERKRNGKSLDDPLHFNSKFYNKEEK